MAVMRDGSRNSLRGSFHGVGENKITSLYRGNGIYQYVIAKANQSREMEDVLKHFRGLHYDAVIASVVVTEGFLPQNLTVFVVTNPPYQSTSAC